MVTKLDSKQVRGAILIVGILLIGLLFLSNPVAGQTLVLEGGDSKQDATTIGSGQEIEIDVSGDNDKNWYRLPVEDPGTLVTLTIGDGTWNHYYIDNIDIGNQRLSEDQITSGKKFNYIVTGRSLYLNFDSDDNGVNGYKFKIATTDPDRDIFEVSNLNVLPTTKLSPNQEITVQSNIYYNRKNIINPETVSATLSIDGEEIETVDASGDPSDNVSVQFEETTPSEGDNPEKELTVQVRPKWADRGGNDKSKTLIIEKRDLDGDGLQRSRELELGTDPNNPDTDGDGINDARELELETDPLKSDTDGDGLDDGAEIKNGADPLVKDTDDDSINDGKEIELGTDPAAKDTDGDTIFDDRELDIGTDPTKSDTDGDGLSDSEEIEAGSDPTDRNSRRGDSGSMLFSAPETATVIGDEVTIEYTVGVNEGARLNGTSVELKNQDQWRITEASEEGEFSQENQEWILLSVGPDENVTLTATIEPQTQMDGKQTITAVAQDSEGRYATADTVVNFDATNVSQAIDQNGNGELELVEIQRAIRLWSENEPVPNTDGEKVTLETLQELIDKWSNDESL